MLINELDVTLCSLIYSLLRFTLHVSGHLATDLNHTSKTLKCTYDCNYSLIVLLMMGAKGARNM
jgi:hypothetical protein